MFRFFAIDKYIDRLVDYLKARLGLIKLDLTRKAYKIAHLLLFLCFVLFVLFMLLLLGHLLLAFALNAWLRTDYLGYLIVMGLQGLWLLLVILLFKNKALYRTGERRLVRMLFDEEMSAQKEKSSSSETEDTHEEDLHEEETKR